MAVSRINEAGLNVNQYGNRNLVINGAMKVAQRGTSFASVSSGEAYTVDRFGRYINAAGTWTITQSTDTPTGQGFANSIKFDCTTANGSLSASSEYLFFQRFEGQDLQRLKKGTANAEKVTLSFWVKSAKTGTYITELYDNNNSRHISRAYTISSANTWEKKILTFDGDTTGAITNNNSTSIQLNFMLANGSNWTSGTLQTSWGANTQANRAVGQVNLADSTSNDWYLTGVQLEVGDTATDFEHRSYAHDLDACSRYYSREDAGSGAAYKRYGVGSWNSATHFECSVALSTPMRSTPTLETTGTASNYGIYSANAIDAVTSLALINDSDDGTYNRMVGIIMTVSSGGVSGEGGTLLANNDTDNCLALDAEL